MAIYHLSVKPISRSTGRTASASSAYRSAEKIRDIEGNLHDYTRKQGVLYKEIVLPKDSPTWAFDRGKLWNAADTADRRKNSQVSREYELALPSELTLNEMEKLVNDFAQYIIKEYGVATDVSIHAPDRQSNGKNFHAHVMTSTRVLTSDGFGNKTRMLDDLKTGPKEIKKIRKHWEILVNKTLEKCGHKARVDCRTLEAQGIDREPTQHEGIAVTAMERKGIKTRVREENNRRREKLQELKELEKELRRLKEDIEELEGDVVAEKKPDVQPDVPVVELLPMTVLEAKKFLEDISAKMFVPCEEKFLAEMAVKETQIEKAWEEARKKYAMVKENEVKPEGVLDGLFDFGFKKRHAEWERECEEARCAFVAIDKKRDEFKWERSSNVKNGLEAIKKQADEDAHKLVERENPEVMKVLKNEENRIQAELDKKQRIKKEVLVMATEIMGKNTFVTNAKNGREYSGEIICKNGTYAVQRLTGSQAILHEIKDISDNVEVGSRVTLRKQGNKTVVQDRRVGRQQRERDDDRGR